MDYEIRLTRTEDIPGIVNLYAEATKLMHRLSPAGFGERLREPIDVKKEQESFSQALADEGTVILVAEKDGEIAGFVMGVVEYHVDDLVDAPYLTVQYICVDERFRRTGMGKALMQEVERWAVSKGITNLDLMVLDTNTPAQSLFRKMGYVPLDIRMGKKLKGK